ncbi:MAG: flagellar biosynthesis protein FlhF [Spirochaetia bacterium]|jgi:flagellar biosynthesis protein FlhF|nr:flagellar biosynthesis protein FlhF [Spirochaetia bacterium]
MEYFTETASTDREAMDKINAKYGERAKILTRRSVRIGGVLGMLTKEGIEMSGYLSDDIQKRKKINLETEKTKIIDSAKNEKTIQNVLNEVQSLKDYFDSSNNGVEKKHNSIEIIENILSENEFSFSYIQAISDRLKRSLTIDELEDLTLVKNKVSEWIGVSININDVDGFNTAKVVILVGPTGVGKTTTIAKLAATHGFNSQSKYAKSVRMITIDNYRIGAKKQIETYGEIMGIPVACVESYKELEQKINLFQNADLILVDTIGKSPKDYMKLAEMREMLDACGTNSEVYLAMSATTKISDVKEILRQFEPFNYKSIILTKLDETMRIGNIISVLSENNKSLTYLTDGQIVPQDIEEVTSKRLMRTVEGLNTGYLIMGSES